MLAENKELDVIRTYSKIIDLFSNIGGIAEVVTFIIAILYSWYNSIKMEGLLLNKGVLQVDNIEYK